MKKIKNVTVIGANGTMGRNISAVFAAFGNTNVYMVSRSLEKSEEAKKKALQSVRAESIGMKLFPADYSLLSECVTKSDLIIECVAENWDIKCEVHHEIAQSCNEDTIICTGTSGLSVTGIAEIYSEHMRKNVIGMHFFNPPYNMVLCELIPTKYTDNELLNDVKEYSNRILKRTSVVVKDMPAFLGNRIGFQFINEALQYAEKYRFNGGIDYIDALLGPFTGRAMPPLVTSDFVGLDVHKAIVDNLYENTNDYVHDTFVMPEFAIELIRAGKLGRKAGEGLYKTVKMDDGKKVRLVYDIEHKKYREIVKYSFPFIEGIVEYLKTGDYELAFNTLKSDGSNEAKLCLEFILKYIVYSLYTSILLGDSADSADDVMVTGFNWCAPLGMVEALGGKVEFIMLCKKYLNDELLAGADFDNLIKAIKSSKYDFRRYIRAHRK